MKYLLSILVLFSGLSFSISKDELKERYLDVNEEDTLLVCDSEDYKNDLRLRFLITISEISDLGAVESYNSTDIRHSANLKKVIETPREFKIPSGDASVKDFILIDRFTLEMSFADGKWQCKKVKKFAYLSARLEIIMLAENTILDRKI